MLTQKRTEQHTEPDALARKMANTLANAAGSDDFYAPALYVVQFCNGTDFGIRSRT